jgi:uncharacterized protein (UPF0276 family)
MYLAKPIQGAGIGLRSAHIQQIINQKPDIGWVELLADNHLSSGGMTTANLHAVRELYPITLHCVSMALGSIDPIDWQYMKKIKDLAKDFEASWVSDHICFTRAGGHHSHDLLPLPYTEEALTHLVKRVKQVQDFLEQPLLMENATSYLRFQHNSLSEAEFINALVSESGCQLICDLNNFYVNQQNHGTDALSLVSQLPLDSIKEIHLAGFDTFEDLLIDAHNTKVAAPVWQLFTALQKLRPGIAAQIEWDNQLPDLSVLLAEAGKAQCIIDDALNEKNSADNALAKS